MDTSPTDPAPRVLSRRTLARGLAWSTPTLALAAVAPAYAASSACSPTLTSQGGLIYGWGGTGGSGTTTQTMTVGAETYVYGLPAGVTVVKITYQWWIMNRQGQDSSGPGAFWVGNRTSSRSTENRSAMPYTTGSRGWRGSLANTVNNTSVMFPDGTSYPAWDLNFLWNGSNGANGTYSSGTDGCTNFVSGPSGRFGVTYTGVTPLARCPSPDGTIPNFNTIEVTLSNGQVLNTSITNNGGSTCK